MLNTRKTQLYIAGITALLRILFVNIAFILAKKIDTTIENSLILYIRSFFGFLLITPFFVKYKLNLVKTSHPILHITRGICGAAAVFCTYYSTRNLPLAVSSAITMSLPLFITLLSFLILHENILPKQWWLLFIGYIGVIVSSNPSPSNIFDFNIFVCIVANLFLAISLIITKILSKTETSITIMFYYNFLILVVAYLANKQTIHNVTNYDIILISAIGVITIITQFCSIKSLAYSSPAFVAPFEYTRIIFAIPLGFMFFNEIPDYHTIIGALIIIYANVMIAKLKIQHKKLNNPAL